MENTENLEQRIVETARDLFIKKGFASTSMSDIAGAVGINRTTLHYYFRTKERMFHAAFGAIMQSILPRIQIIFEQDTPISDKLARVLDEYIANFSQNPSLPAFIIGEIQRDVNHLLDAGRALHLDSYLSAIEQVILAEMDRGTIRKIPIPIFLLSFISQLTFPFLAKNLMTALFYENDNQYSDFLTQWKANIMHQLETYLLVRA